MKFHCYTQDAEPVLVSKDAKLAFEEWLKIRSGTENIIDDKAVFINKTMLSVSLYISSQDINNRDMPYYLLLNSVCPGTAST